MNSRRDAYKCLLDAQEYLKYQDMTKFPHKAKKKLPYETLRALATIEAALQVDYRLCKMKHIEIELRKLKKYDGKISSKTVNTTVDSCIAVIKRIMENGV